MTVFFVEIRKVVRVFGCVLLKTDWQVVRDENGVPVTVPSQAIAEASAAQVAVRYPNLEWRVIS